MTGATQPLHEEHEALLVHIEHIRAVAREVPRLDRSGRVEAVSRIVSFLRDTLMPHAEAEERVLYPEVGQLVGALGATEPMVHDHRVIAEYADALEREGGEDVLALQELLFGLHALVVSHFRKEEELYLPLLDAAHERAVAVLAALEGEPLHAHAH